MRTGGTSFGSRFYRRMRRFLGGVAPGALDVLSTRQNDDGSSFSGKERSHLFLSLGAKQFADVSGISGVDSILDARSFVRWDYDRDGWVDFATINSNAPKFEIFRSRLGARSSEAPGMIALRFVGGGSSSGPAGFSNRDGYGARVDVNVGDLRLRREHLAGEGRAAQNSSTMIVGIGRRDAAVEVSVTWPSKNVQRTLDVAEGTLLTVYEDESQSPTGAAFVREPYRRSPLPSPAVAPAAGSRSLLFGNGDGGHGAPLRFYTTMATWCESCAAEIPQLAKLRERFKPDELEMYAIPVDAADTKEKLDGWMSRFSPPYKLVDGVTPDDVARVEQVILEELGHQGTPATLFADAAGNIVWAQWGPPTVSKVRELLDAAEQ